MKALQFVESKLYAGIESAASLITYTTISAVLCEGQTLKILAYVWRNHGRRMTR